MNKIGIFSVPRSGSTWLGQIFNSSPNVTYRFQPNFAYSFQPTLSNNSTKQEINLFFEELIRTEDDFVNARISISGKKNITFDKATISSLVFKETHYIGIIRNLLEQCDDIKIVGLIRSPFASINSWLKIPKEFNHNWDVKEEWRNAPSKNDGKEFMFFGYEKWKETTRVFLYLEKRFPNQFIIQIYEDLLSRPILEVEKLFNFCNIEYTQQTEEFLETSKSKNDNDLYSVFKQKKSDNEWENELPNYIIEEIKNDKDFQELNKRFNWI